MATTTGTDSAATKQMKKTIDQQSSEISKLRNRVSKLVDDIHIMKNDISTFKALVSKDMKGIVETIENK